MSTHEDDLRKENVTLQVSNIQDSRELHLLLKRELDFPDFYGMNWDAFWDAITGLVELPETLSFNGWDKLTTVLPDDSQTLSDLLRKFNEKHPSWHCKVVYK
ncbi:MULTISPECIES: barstar family protein [Paenibacillus]|jgi:ribonuclease inhibitor|uniref:barstar family protein n=1 Tax=Paenibacillus TaxID=44249 RepID=UPI00096E1DD6|nr:barstar family protein [Paenibacillus odorifer]OMD68258.1 barnase inhibitor [Paenibacillus odorifer]OMD81089.1 barnase inhibitor [Paenibacillus odorifer]OMD96429.1 barnase inhibitor [Paenibacillus odorifer]